MWNTRTDAVTNEVTCPGCGLSCDDLCLEIRDGQLKSVENGCTLARTHYASAFESTNRDPGIKGKKASIGEALECGAALLNSARNPLFAGLATDVNGMRATLELADRCGATLDHMNGDGLFRNTRVLQDSGWFTTTFTEVRNRADLIVLLGTQWVDRFPRLIERVLHPANSLFSTLDERRFVLLGPWGSTRLPHDLQALNPQLIPVRLEQLADVASLLRGLIAGRPVTAGSLGNKVGDQLEKLAEGLQAARYSVVSWSAAELNFPHAELAIQNLVELVKDLNHSTRSAALPLAGTQADTTTNQVCTWQLGYPLRSGLQRGYPEHDPVLNRYQDLLQRKEVDLLLWISSLSQQPRLPDTDLPTIVLGHPGLRFSSPPDVYIPTGVPGVDHPGHWYRSDSVCPLPLGQLRESTLPAVSQVLAALNRKLQTGAGQ